MRELLTAAASGAAGAGTVTAVHQAARAWVKGAPRMDIVGMRGLRKLLPATRGLSRRDQYRATLLAELISNTAYYSLVSLGGRRSLGLGTALGALAGAGAVALTPALGLGRWPVLRRRSTPWMTFSWYLFGGVVAGALNRLIARR